MQIALVTGFPWYQMTVVPILEITITMFTISMSTMPVTISIMEEAVLAGDVEEGTGALAGGKQLVPTG